MEKETLEHFAEIYPGKEREMKDALYYLTKEKVRAKILDKGIRPDGRGLTDIRNTAFCRACTDRASSREGRRRFSRPARSA